MVFDEFSAPEEDTFDKTVVPLRLAQHAGESLVSRSQAKRISRHFEKFKRVELDFAGIAEIDQAFADEMFRVFAAAHPEIQVTAINTSEALARSSDALLAWPENRFYEPERRTFTFGSGAGALPCGLGDQSSFGRCGVDRLLKHGIGDWV